MTSRPHGSQAATCPPSAAVRQAMRARTTVAWPGESVGGRPCRTSVRSRSATSGAGPGTQIESPLASNRSKGLAVSCSRWADTCV